MICHASQELTYTKNDASSGLLFPSQAYKKEERQRQKTDRQTKSQTVTKKHILRETVQRILIQGVALTEC